MTVKRPLSAEVIAESLRWEADRLEGMATKLREVAEILTTGEKVNRKVKKK